MNRLDIKIKELPKSPGVYHFLDENGGVLYVGKAKNLSNRVKQYFLKELGRGPAIDQMVKISTDIKWIETESEIEAVLLEAELIKKLKPKYNIRQKDDKSFLVIKITRKISNSEFLISNKMSNADNTQLTNQQINQSTNYSCVELVRFKNVDLKDKTADYFGPYPAGDLLKKSMRYLRRIFPYRDCSTTKYKTYAKLGRPCIYGEIGVCTAPCVGRIDPENYDKNIRLLKSFLRGNKQMVITSIEKSMKKASREKKYEEATVYRNRLKGLLHLKDVGIGLRDDLYNFNSSLFPRIECYDISGIFDKYAVGSMVVFANGKADKDEYKKFKVKSQKSKVKNTEELPSSDLERLRQVLRRRFARSIKPHPTSPSKGEETWTMPNLIVIDGGNQQLQVAKDVLKELNLNIPIVSISKGKKRDKNDFHFSDSNIAKFFQGDTALQSIVISSRDEAHRFAISYYRKIHKKDLFND